MLNSVQQPIPEGERKAMAKTLTGNLVPMIAALIPNCPPLSLAMTAELYEKQPIGLVKRDGELITVNEKTFKRWVKKNSRRITNTCKMCFEATKPQTMVYVTSRHPSARKFYPFGHPGIAKLKENMLEVFTSKTALLTAFPDRIAA